VVVGWKSDSHEVGRQGSYDNVTMGKSPIRWSPVMTNASGIAHPICLLTRGKRSCPILKRYPGIRLWDITKILRYPIPHKSFVHPPVYGDNY
jgi:hypothetical protein